MRWGQKDHVPPIIFLLVWCFLPVVSSQYLHIFYQFNITLFLASRKLPSPTPESAKLRGLRGLVGGVGGVGRKFAWVAWVYKILGWVKKMAWVGIFAWVAWVHEIVLLKRHY